MEHIKDSSFDGKKDKKDPKPWPPEWQTVTLTFMLQPLSNTEKLTFWCRIVMLHLAPIYIK